MRTRQKIIAIILLVIATLTIAITALLCGLFALNGSTVRLLNALNAGGITEQELGTVLDAYARRLAEDADSDELAPKKIFTGALNALEALTDVVPQKKVTSAIYAYFKNEPVNPLKIIGLMSKYSKKSWTAEFQKIGGLTKNTKSPSASFRGNLFSDVDAQTATELIYSVGKFTKNNRTELDRLSVAFFSGLKDENFLDKISFYTLGDMIRFAGAALSQVNRFSDTLGAAVRAGILPERFNIFSGCDNTFLTLCNVAKSWTNQDTASIITYYPDWTRLAVNVSRALIKKPAMTDLKAVGAELNGLFNAVYGTGTGTLGDRLISSFTQIAALDPAALSSESVAQATAFADLIKNLLFDILNYLVS